MTWRSKTVPLVLLLPLTATACNGDERGTSASGELPPPAPTPVITAEEVAPTAEEIAAPLKYQVVERKDYSFGTTERMSYRVVVQTEELPDEATLRATVESIWRGGNRRWSEFTVFLYMPEMNTADVAYVAAEFSPRGMQDFTIHRWALGGTKWVK